MSTGTSFSVTLPVTTGARPPSPPRAPRPPRPPAPPGPAAEGVLPQELAAAPAAMQKRMSARPEMDRAVLKWSVSICWWIRARGPAHLPTQRHLMSLMLCLQTDCRAMGDLRRPPSPRGYTRCMVEPLIRDISDTARWVAVYRARETERSDALFKDPFARALAGERGEHIARALPYADKTSWSFIARTVLFDRIVDNAVAGGVDLVVNLAAGLDTRPYRMSLPSSLRWVEADLPEILDYKEE